MALMDWVNKGFSVLKENPEMANVLGSAIEVGGKYLGDKELAKQNQKFQIEQLREQARLKQVAVDDDRAARAWSDVPTTDYSLTSGKIAGGNGSITPTNGGLLSNVGKLNG